MIGLITATGFRADQFRLCQTWMARQTYRGEVVWVITDDCIPRTTDAVTDNFKENWTIIKVYPVPLWRPGLNTQARNIVAGIQILIDKYPANDIEAIFIIEDDDYYRPIYLERMMANLGDYDIIGERNTIYYNVAYRRHITNCNTESSSLFQTAFKYNVLCALNECLSCNFIDYHLWSKVLNKNLFYENDLSVGIKGMSGRGGIGGGHQDAMNMRPDPKLSYLNALIGEQDAALYAQYYRSGRIRR